MAYILISLCLLLCYGVGESHQSIVDQSSLLSFWNIAGGTPGQPGKLCCFPPVWQCTVHSKLVIEGSPEQIYYWKGNGFIDQNNQRAAEDVTTMDTNSQPTTLSYILLFNGSSSSATLYAFSKADRKCYKEQLTNAKFKNQCLPPNSGLLDSFVLGTGSSTINAQAWGFNITIPGTAVAGVFIFNPDNCGPIMAEQRVSTPIDDGFTTKPWNFDITTLLVNMKETVSDPSVFTPPPYCNGAESGPLPQEFYIHSVQILFRYVAHG